MSKKDYKLIAASLELAKDKIERNCVGDERVVALGAWRVTVECLTDTLERTNPRFDRDRFLAACGVG